MKNRTCFLGAAFIVLIGLYLLVAPLFMSKYFIHIMATTYIWLLCIGGLNFLTTAGYVSICQAGFYGIGAYTAVLCAQHFGTPPVVSCLAGMASAGVGALIIGFPSFRLRGHYFPIITLAFVLMINLVLQNWTALTKGDTGIFGFYKPSVGDNGWYYILMAISIVFLLFSRVLLKSKFGRKLVAIGEDENLANQLGINSLKIKLIAICISGCMAGLAGGLNAYYLNYIHPNFYTLAYSFTMLVGVLIGGIGSTLGSSIGALIAVGLPEALRFSGDARFIALGVLLILQIAFLSKGIGGTFLNYLNSRERQRLLRGERQA